MIYSKRIHFETIPSTNSYLKENYHHLMDGTVVSADNQTQGRGRLDRRWINGDDVLVSILLKDNLDFNESSKISLVTAASVHYSLSKYADKLHIKWPNDILHNDKKMAGILIETIINNKNLECLIIGIGINLNTLTFPNELAQKATSLRQITNLTYNVKKFTQEVLDDFEKFYLEFKNNSRDYIHICREHSCLIGSEVIIDHFDKDRLEQGIVLDILENGNIFIRVGYEIRQYNSGEISLLRNYK